MADSQFRGVADICSAMKQFSTQSSQPAARGSFSTLDNLAQFSEAIAFLCDEITQLKAELNEIRSQAVDRKEPMKQRTPRASGRVAPLKSSPLKPTKTGRSNSTVRASKAK
jgi:uncharacterized small protein (DUF1192 family)